MPPTPEPLAIAPHPHGCTVGVQASPGAKRDRLVGRYGGGIKIAVRAPPEDGRANRAIADLLAELLDVGREDVELLAGPTRRGKRFLVRGLTCDEVIARLERAL